MGDVLQVSKRIEEADEEKLEEADSGRGSRRPKELFGRTGKGRWRPWVIAGASACSSSEACTVSCTAALSAV